tara:strand:+ start:9237 stop:9893 length:657 start_codon:yes stop_codon:yes gene_type:complete
MAEVKQLIVQKSQKTVRDIYEQVQHWSWHDLSKLADLIMEPAVWITGEDAVSDRERIMVKNDKRLISVLAGLKCFWLLDQTKATDIHFFDIRRDNLEIKKQMLKWIYRDKIDPRDKLVDLARHFNYNIEDPLWDKIGKRDISDCTFTWTLVNICQKPEFIIDLLDVTPASVYLSNIFDDDNDSTHLYSDFSSLKKALRNFQFRGGKVWMHGDEFVLNI